MAKQQYTRRDSGLLLPCDSLVVGRVNQPRPWWAGKLNPARGFSRRRCCCQTPAQASVICSACSGTGNNASMEVLLTVDGLYNGSCPNSTAPTRCEEGNGNYVVRYSGSCIWLLQINGVALCRCGQYEAYPVFGTWVTFSVTYDGTNTQLSASLTVTQPTNNGCGNVNSFAWTKTVSGKIDCLNLNETLSYFTVSGYQDVCGSDSTATVRAI